MTGRREKGDYLMYTLGLDIGTTSISLSVLDTQSAKLCHCESVASGADVPGASAWERIQDVARIEKVCAQLLTRAYEKTRVDCIGISAQMHGIVYVDREGGACSPLYTWQDGRGEQPWEDTSYAGYLSRAAGRKTASGYGLTTHFYNIVNHLVPDEATSFCTIGDYIAMRLTGRKTPLISKSMAASLGLFDAEDGVFRTGEAARWFAASVAFPEIADTYQVLGETEKGAVVVTCIGDNQASFCGSVRQPEESVLVNVGTGGQISLLSPTAVTGPDIEARPYPAGKWLLVGSSLCGGRAYAALERFFRDCVKMATGSDPGSLYEKMSGCVARSLAQSPLTVRTCFAGTRQDPGKRGAISGLSLDNFTPAHFINGTMTGIAAEMKGYYDQMQAAAPRPITKLVAAGNGIRKNPNMAKAFAREFGLPLFVPVHTEEAAFGAALTALVGSRAYPDFDTAAELIEYR